MTSSERNYLAKGQIVSNLFLGLGIVSNQVSDMVDILFLNGGKLLNLPEYRISTSYSWSLSEQVDANTYIDILENKYFDHSKQKQLNKFECNIIRQLEVLALSHTFPELEPLSIDSVNENKLVVSNIRKLLKTTDCKFSVRYSKGEVVISWEDGPSFATIDKLTARFDPAIGTRMDDTIVYSDDPWTRVFGSIRYIHLDRSISDLHIFECLTSLYKQYKQNFRLAKVPKPTVEQYRKGDLYQPIPGLPCRPAIDSQIGETLKNMSFI